NPSFVEFFKNQESILTDRSNPLLQRIRFLEQLGLMKKTQDPALEKFYQRSFQDFGRMESDLNKIYLDGILNRFQLENSLEIKEGLERVLQEWGNLDPLLAILGGLLKDSRKYPEEVQVFREAVYHIFNGDFSAWRKGEIPSIYARVIDYMKGEKSFWDPWIKNDTTEIPEVNAPSQKRTYENVRIFDTDDPYWILRRGELTEQLKNCF